MRSFCVGVNAEKWSPSFLIRFEKLNRHHSTTPYSVNAMHRLNLWLCMLHAELMRIWTQGYVRRGYITISDSRDSVFFPSAETWSKNPYGFNERTLALQKAVRIRPCLLYMISCRYLGPCTSIPVIPCEISWTPPANGQESCEFAYAGHYVAFTSALGTKSGPGRTWSRASHRTHLHYNSFTRQARLFAGIQIGFFVLHPAELMSGLAS